MTWFKVDDKFWSHRKTMFTSLAARGLWTSAGSYCADHLTDGVIESEVLHTIVPGPRATIDKLAAELVARKLWEPTAAGWLFHDWPDHQPTKEEVEESRRQNRERQKRNRDKRRREAEAAELAALEALSRDR